MTDNEMIELTRAYVALSNAHRIDLVMPMFAAGASYISSTMGEHRGRAAIGDMLHGYFNRHPDSHLETDNYRCEDNCVSFSFTMTATAAEDGAAVERRGVQRFEFTADGSIKKIRVDSA